jgi:hypothetical protein
LAQSGRTELRQLREVFDWCESHGIALSTLDLPENIAKYRQAASKLRHRTKADAVEADKKRQMPEAIEFIKLHRTRDETRALARTPHKAKGESPSEDGSTE